MVLFMIFLLFFGGFVLLPLIFYGIAGGIYLLVESILDKLFPSRVERRDKYFEEMRKTPQKSYIELLSDSNDDWRPDLGVTVGDTVRGLFDIPDERREEK